MAYREIKYLLGDSIETEIKYSGKCGAKGEKRAPKRKATKEQIKKQNHRNKATYVRRLIKLNFKKNDLLCTLKYLAGTRKSMKEVMKDFVNFIKRMRRAYSKLQAELKYIYRVEIGKRGGIHIHIILNRAVDGHATEVLVQDKWFEGRVNNALLYEKGGYEELADYIVKGVDEEVEKQLSLFDEKEQKQLLSYNCSRNLVRPVPEVKEYKRRTVHKILAEGPKPAKGFYIDKSSIVQGINPYTGYSYLYYTEYRLGKVPWEGVP